MSVKYKYGQFEEMQIVEAKEKLHKKIRFLLFVVDPRTSEKYAYIDVEQAIINIQNILGGLNELLFYPRELVFTSSFLEAALLEYKSADFQFSRFKKLILDAGNEILKVKEVE